MMDLLTKLFGWFLVASLFLFPLILYRKLYFRYVTAIQIDHELSPLVVPVKPSRAFFAAISCGSASSLVPLGSGYFAFYVATTDDDTRDLHRFNDFTFIADVYIFRRNRLGRFTSVDLSDRVLADIIKKFH